jgi:hypothetical protein
MKSFLYYTGNMGFCANLNGIIRAIEYCSRNSMKLYICCEYGMHGDLMQLFDFGHDIEFVKGMPPGYSIQGDNPLFEVAHPDWDHGPNTSLDNYNKMYSIDISFERQREIALRFIPKIPDERTPAETFDAIHIRRGDALTAGEGGKYFHAMDYLAKTTCDDVFVMSDDHRVIDEISGPKKIHHMIPEDEIGNWGNISYVTEPGQPVFILRNDKMKLIVRLIQEMYIAAKSQTFLYTNSCVGHFVSLIHRDPTRCINLQSPPSD